MLQTLFYLPREWFGLPGVIAWLLLCLLWLGWVAWRESGTPGRFKDEFWATLPIMIFGSIAIMFLLPNLSKPTVNPLDPFGDPINRGLAIRGYGVMMMLAVLAGIGIVVYRCQKIGYPTEHIFRLAIWMVVCGLLGARLFFVIQNHDQFFRRGASAIETLQGVFDMVGGGLVVYGSMIGAMLAAAFVVWRWKLPIWKTADLIAPGMALGLAIGRIGCLLNGCCWGGVCDLELPAITFPAGSPPYMQQLQSGQLLGIETESTDDPWTYRVIDAGGGVGRELGLSEGEMVAFSGPTAEQVRYLIGSDKAKSASLRLSGDQLGPTAIPLSKLPGRSRGVHPTQIYSSINALVLCLFLWFYWHVRRNDGEVMGLMLFLYPISRFVLELIRNDESGQFGTELTISQWVSLLTIACGVALFFGARMFGTRSEFVQRTAETLPSHSG